MSDVETAQAHADECWATHEGARGPLRDELRNLMVNLEGVTGLQPGPGSDNLVDRFLDFAEFHAEDLTTAASARAEAMKAQDKRDEAKANEPVAPPTPAPSALDDTKPEDVRAWLRNANDNDVRDALNSVLDAEAQQTWARQLMAWARADGTTAQVLAAINEKLHDGVDRTPMDAGDAVAQVGGSTTYGTTTNTTTLNYPEVTTATETANADAEPATDAPADVIAAWVGDDVGRARVRYDQENERADGPRPEVLAVLVEVLDTDAGDTP